MPQGLAPPTDFTVTAVDVGSVPVITAVCRIDGLGMVPGLGDGGVQPHPFRQEIRLFVAGGHVVRERVALRHTDDVVLRGARLDVLVDLGDGSRYEESVGPAAVLHPGFQLAEQREIVVVETRQVLDHESGPVFVAHFHVAHQVVVLRIVRAQDGFEDQSGLLAGILGVEICLVGMEGADAVGKIEIVAGAAARDDVHGAAQCVAAEAGGNHALVDFHTVDDVHGQVGQRHAGSLGVERHPVEEIADGVAAHPVDRQVELTADPALLADPDAGRPVDGLGQ